MTAPGAMVLNEQGSVTLDDTGAGSIRFRPDSAGEWWLPTLIAVSVQTAGADNPPESICRVYVGHKVSPLTFLDITYSGTSGASSGRLEGRTIGSRRDPYVFAVWEGGEPGATGTAIITGTKVRAR